MFQPQWRGGGGRGERGQGKGSFITASLSGTIGHLQDSCSWSSFPVSINHILQATIVKWVVVEVVVAGAGEAEVAEATAKWTDHGSLLASDRKSWRARFYWRYVLIALDQSSPQSLAMAARKAKSAEAVAALGEQQERMEALLEEAKVTCQRGP